MSWKPQQPLRRVLAYESSPSGTTNVLRRRRH